MVKKRFDTPTNTTSMTNLNLAVSARRSQNTVQRSISYDLPCDIDNVIERIENIRLTRDRPTLNDKNGNEDNDREHGRDSDDADEENLIERGPTKLPIRTSSRNQPYHNKGWQSETNETYVIDKAVKKILRDEELREKLNPCFEQLGEECSSQIVQDLQWDLFDDAGYENYSIDDLLKNVQDGLLQSAQCPTEYSPIGWPKTTEPCFDFSLDNTVVGAGAASGLDSRDSSPIRSPGSLARDTEDPGRAGLNFGQSPVVQSLRVTSSGASASLRPGQVFSRSSLSSSSSVSNQSYGDTHSSNSSCHVENIPFDWDQTHAESLIQELMKSLEGELRNPSTIENDTLNDTLKLEESREQPRGDNINSNVFRNHDNITTVLGENGATGKMLPYPDIVAGNVCSLSNTITSDFQIPTTVPSFESFESSSRCVRTADRSIMPWSILNLPSKYSEKASERLKEMLDPNEMKRAMVAILKRSPEELAKQDEDGYTTLMCLVSSPDELARNTAYLVPLVERLTTEAFTVKNNRGEDALYLAAINCSEFPFVAAYLAATMLDKGIDLNQRSYRGGDTLIHSIAAKGDSHRETLAELLALKTARGNRLFDLSKLNHDGRTALHVAIKSHEPFTKRITSLAVVSLLLKYGADPRTKETETGNNALHAAISSSCDPLLVKLLLKNAGSELVNATNENLDTPLRMAAAISSNGKPIESAERQTDVCRLLIDAGSDMNFQQKIPFTLTCTGTEKTVGETFYKTS